MTEGGEWEGYDVTMELWPFGERGFCWLLSEA